MESLLYWSDSKTLFFRWVYILLGLLLAFALVPVAPTRWFERFKPAKVILWPWIFSVIVVAFILVGRWPGLFYPSAFNPDEDQLVVAAMQLAEDPVFFRSAECGSSGPLNVYPLILPTLFGADISLFSARLIGIIMLAGSILGIYFAARIVVHECAARVTVASITVFLGLTTFWDFVHYTSEHPPVFYLSVAWAAAFASGFGKDFSKRNRLILACIAAVFLSLVPFAKLQGTLLALVSGIAVLALPLLWNRKDIRKSIKEIVLIGASSLAFPLLFSLFLAINGAFEYFWNCYIQSSLLYKGAGAGGITRWELIAMVLFADGAMRPVDLLLFLSGSLLFFLICLPVLLFPSKKKLPVSGWIFLGVSGILLAATIWTVTSTMRNYPHYFYFLPFAVTLVLAGIMSLLISKAARERNLPNDRFPAYELAISLIFLMLTAYPLLEFFASRPHPRVGSAKTWSKNPPITPISQKIIELAEGQKGRLTIWGYNPVYYRETGMLSATRLSTSSALFDFNKLQPFFLARYLEDLEKHRPIIFVDAVAPDQFVIMNDREKHGFEKIAPIKEFVEKNYDFVEEIDGVRFFRLKGASPKAN